MAQDTKKAAKSKPSKPYADFPLFAHATGRWAKKIRGKFHYFGPWNDWQSALEKYQKQRDDLHAGRTPRITGDGLTVRDLANRFLTAKQQQQDADDITFRTFDDYHKTCGIIVDAFGKTRLVDDLASDDFEQLRAKLAKKRSANTLGNEVQRIRCVFNYGHSAGLIDRAVRFGPIFKRPSKRKLRAHRQQQGSRLYDPADLRKILESAKHPMKAMILLGINCGFGNSDCGRLPFSALDLKAGWVEFPRPKTAIERRCPLWPETVKALRESQESRPEPKLPEHEQLVFITRRGGPWANNTAESPITGEMRKLLDDLKLYRQGLSFYSLRHSFETIAGECRDQVAVDAIMGHSDPSMAANYRDGISDARLKDAANTVRRWLFGRKKAK